MYYVNKNLLFVNSNLFLEFPLPLVMKFFFQKNALVKSLKRMHLTPALGLTQLIFF